MLRFFKFQHFIVLFLLSFVMFILFLVFKTTQVHHEHVQKNYFYEELKYNQRNAEMERWERSGADVKLLKEKMCISLPDSLLLNAKIQNMHLKFIFNSDERLDTSMSLLANRENCISLSSLPHRDMVLEIVLINNENHSLARNRFSLKYPWKSF